MLRATATASSRICAECLLHRSPHAVPSRGQSTASAFESRQQQQPQEYSVPYGRSGSTSYSGQQRPRNGVRSTYSPHNSSRLSQESPNDNQQRKATGRPQSLMKDWKAASPSSSSSPTQRFGQQTNKTSSAVTFRGGMRRDAPPPTRRTTDSDNQRSNQRHNAGPSNSTSSNNSSSTNIRSNYSFTPGNLPSKNTSATGHRGNLKAHAPKYDASTPEKEKPRQVNFGHGSALAAFAMKKNQEQQKAIEQAMNASTSPTQANRSTKANMQNAGKQQAVVQRKNVYNRRAPKKTVEIPSTVSVNALSQILGMKLRRLQYSMERMGLTDTRADRLLPAEDASLVAGELGYQAEVVDTDTGFDIYASPPPEDPSSLTLRPPIVTIMGHVDHGKTSLLDALRSTKVAAGEAGGITQHIGAFNVPVSSLLSPQSQTGQSEDAGSITFLDTPGHAAFAAMRSRGASVTDVAVLVVAADDGVKPQTKEVINLVKNNEDVGLVIAITKCDKPGIDISRVHNELFSHGLEVEAMGGDIPCVEVSAHTRKGLDDLVETINVVAEVRDLRSELQGIPSEGRIIESRVDKGRGNVTTVIVTRGTLKLGSLIIAGKSFARVRQLTSGEGLNLEEATPGIPVEVTGWKILPEAGDQVLEAKTEEEAKKAIETRKRREERIKNLGDLEAINEKRRILNDAQILKKKLQEAAKRNGQDVNSINASTTYDDGNDGSKLLNLVIKCDFTGTEEAVSSALAEIGNSEARVKIVETGVGDVTDGDLALAKAVDGVIVGFNVKASRQILSTAQQLHIPILQNNVIYRLIDEVKERVIALLPKLYDQRVLGEATIQQVFKYTVKGSGTKSIAGCRVTNGQLSKKAKVRIVREGETIFDGNMASLKHHKEEVDEMRKGSDCGVMLDGYEGFADGDVLQCYEQTERRRTL